LSFPAGVSAYTSATNGAGLYALASAANGPTRAVYAVDSSPQGYAGYFQGRGYFSTGVGIGTPNPGAELEVHGDIKMGSNGQYFASGGTENLRIVRGIVRPDGTVFPGTTTNGAGFSITKTGTGTYSITFSPAFADVPSLTITPYTSGSPVTADCTSGNPFGFGTITTWIGAIKADNWWNFIAIGGR
jgi:hypothetical protein